MLTPTIRPFVDADWPVVWPFLHETLLPGDTLAYPPESTESDMHTAWTQAPALSAVAVDVNDRPTGMYYLKANQPGLGAHVCNAGYVVAGAARGRGVAAALCEHSQATARDLGFRGMQFNLVVASNTGAVRLWQKLGFAIVGTLPGAFAHRGLGFVDAHVMFKSLL